MFKKIEFVEEENIKIPIFGDKISKSLEVFYNPQMKLNRDISILLINNYFEKKIDFCDPMIASGIRELRLLKIIPDKFNSLSLGDISKTAIKNAKKNFKINKIKQKNISFFNTDALNTINSKYFDYIELDPFGSPVPFIDIACQKIKHNGILSITATDTAALCGTYPKTSLRKYGINTYYTYFYEELGLRNLIAYSKRQAAKYNKVLKPIISYTNKHYYKVFFKVEESKSSSYESIKNLKYLSWNPKTQNILILDTKNINIKNELLLGPTYIGNLNDKSFIKKLIENSNILEEKKEVLNLLNSLYEELDIIGHYNIHKLQKEYKIKERKFSEIIELIEKSNFLVSRPHNSKFTLKTNASSEELIKILL